jgi:hypothetical protein
MAVNKLPKTVAASNPLGLSEDQALTRWCPFARCLDSDGSAALTSTNRPLKTDQGRRRTAINCIASECMAWRAVGRGRGYCGLAGPLVSRPAP